MAAVANLTFYDALTALALDALALDAQVCAERPATGGRTIRREASPPPGRGRGRCERSGRRARWDGHGAAYAPATRG